MKRGTFWSDSMDLRMFKAVEGGLTLPEPWAHDLEVELRAWGYQVLWNKVLVPGIGQVALSKSAWTSAGRGPRTREEN